MRASIQITCIASFLGLVTACGGSKQEAEEPTASSGDKSAAEEHPSDKASDSSEASDHDGKDEKKSDDDKKGAGKKDKADKGSDGEAKPARTAKDIITKPDSLYVYSFTDSEPHQNAEKKCKESSKDDPKKTADCMTRAGKGQDRDAMAFQEDGDGKLWWLTINRAGGKLTALHKIPFEIGDDSEKKITIKPHGKDEGSKPMGGIPRELTIDLDGESQISIQDPKLGRLVYQMKLGIMGKQDR